MTSATSAIAGDSIKPGASVSDDNNDSTSRNNAWSPRQASLTNRERSSGFWRKASSKIFLTFCHLSSAIFVATVNSVQKLKLILFISYLDQSAGMSAAMGCNIRTPDMQQ